MCIEFQIEKYTLTQKGKLIYDTLAISDGGNPEKPFVSLFHTLRFMLDLNNPGGLCTELPWSRARALLAMQPHPPGSASPENSAFFASHHSLNFLITQKKYKWCVTCGTVTLRNTQINVIPEPPKMQSKNEHPQKSTF